jgi:beta-glucanase (GH16 family)
MERRSNSRALTARSGAPSRPAWSFLTLILLAALLLPAARAAAATTAASFTCEATVVSSAPRGESLTVQPTSCSGALGAAAAGTSVTIVVGRRVTLVNGATASPVAPATTTFSIAALIPGSCVHVDGTASGLKGHSPSYAATRIVLESVPAATLAWSDEFSGLAGTSPDATRWQIDTGGTGFGNNELECYTAQPGNVRLDGLGDLALTAQRQTCTMGGNTRSYTSGKVETMGRFAAAYGSIQARIALPAGRGLWPAFWAVGADIGTVGWPACGEMDVMENLGQDPGHVFGSIHGPLAGKGGAYGLTAAARLSGKAGTFHVYGVNWKPGFVQMTVDGVPYATYTPSSLGRGQQWVFDKPFSLILNLAVGGNWPGAPGASTPFPATMLVDWVRAYTWTVPSGGGQS